jgi:hypothetical protein
MATLEFNDIETWLASIGLAEYATLFRENDLNVILLPELTNDDLKELGVTSLGHRKQLLRRSPNSEQMKRAIALDASNRLQPLTPNAVN